MRSRRRFLRDCSIAAAGVAIVPGEAVAESRRRAASSAMPALEQFAQQLNTAFSLRSGFGAQKILLVDASSAPQALPHSEDGRNERFTLLFRGSAQSAVEQNTYTLEHARLGRVEMFIVPTASSDARFVYYSAVFNYAVMPVDLIAQLANAPAGAAAL